MTHFLNMHMGTIGLIFFFIFFVFMMIWIFRPGSKDIYQSQANIPLKEGKDE